MNYTLFWKGQDTQVNTTLNSIRQSIADIEKPLFIVKQGSKIGFTTDGNISTSPSAYELLGQIPQISIPQLGDTAFIQDYGIKYPYMVGAMAGGISSEKMVIDMANAGFIASYGAAGCTIQKLNEVILRLKSALPQGNFVINLIHNFNEPKLEIETVKLFIKHKLKTIEASAFMDITPALVLYRLSGLVVNGEGKIMANNKIIAKLSREEVAEKFMLPAPTKLVAELVASGLITEKQAELSKSIPMADDITAEADSGGHTDNRPFINLLPSILSLRDRIQEQFKYKNKIRVGAAGGISTPESALASFTMGAAYIVVGSVHHSCVESGTSLHAKKILSEVRMADMMMCPCADMFELGSKVQVVKKGTLFPMRAQKLWDLYKNYPSIQAIPTSEKEKLEKQIFGKSIDAIWAETTDFFKDRDPELLRNANSNDKKRMALIFRWYLGKSSKWAIAGEKNREMDYQIWCGPAMGAFNAWVEGSYLEKPENRFSPEIAKHILTGAAYLKRISILKLFNIQLPSSIERYYPQKNITQHSVI